MIVPPKEFFQFCAKHVGVLRELEQRGNGTDLSEAEIANIVQHHALDSDEQPTFVIKQLKNLRILVSADQTEGYFLMAEPVRGILRYLLEEAKPASSETVQSYINRLQQLAQKLRDALAAENPTLAELALADTTHALRRLHDDVSATHVSVLAEVARYKTDKRPVSVLEKYQRIVWWMQQYIAPMLDVIRVDGPMQATFAEVEEALEAAAANSFVISLDAAERNLRLVRVTRRHALNVFEQSGKEISPLYQSLARSSNLATGAAWALGPYRREDFFDERDRVRKPADVNTQLVDRDYQSLKKPSEHRAILLSNAAQRNNGLGIVALKDGERYSDFRDTLKNLLNLANIAQDQMRERLLMLAGLPTDYVAIDARRILGDDYEQLRRERDELSLFKNHQSDVQSIIQLFNERQVLWGRLNYRWQDLKARKKIFDEEHTARVANVTEKIATARQAAEDAKQAADKKQKEKEGLLQRQSPIDVQLKMLEKNKKAYAGFAEQFEQVTLDNLERRVNDLLNRQQEASTETAESVQAQLQAAENEIEATAESIHHFSRLAITSLREHFSDDDIARMFRVLNPELLGLAVGRTGITLSNSKDVVTRLRQLVSRITDGVYQDESMTVRLGPTSDILSKFQNVEALEKELERQKKQAARLSSLLEAVTRHAEIAKAIHELRTQKEEQSNKLAAYRQFQKDLASESQWRDDFNKLERAINAAAQAVRELDAAREQHREELSQLDLQRKAADTEYQEVLRRYDQCQNRVAIFNAAPRADAEIPDDFDSAVSVYLREHTRATDMSRDLEVAFVRLGVFADRYKGHDEAETIRNLEQELDALAKREEALQLRWNSQIHALKGRFQEVLNDLRLIESAKDKLNRELAHIHVSDLKSVKLTIERQSDEVSLIERLANIGELNLMDDTTPLDRVFERVRAKMGRNPVTRIADLFVLGVHVTRADNTVKKYPDFHQVESDGTTITIKVIFNLLVLKSLLHKDDVAIPFFLDESQDLDPANQRAVLHTAKKLGFIAITAAPSAIGEVDACYFLEPNKQGRVLLTEDQRLSMKPKVQSTEA